MKWRRRWRGGSSSADLTVVAYEPARDARDVNQAAAVKLIFNREIRALELDKVYINDSAGKKVEDVKATVDGKTLIITHSTFKDETTYTVYIPEGTVAYKSGSTKNRAISWSFTTKAAAVRPVVPPVEDGDIPESRGDCTFSDLPSSHWPTAWSGKSAGKK